MKSIEYLSISPSDSIKEALLKMDANNCKLLIVIADNEFKGLISIGDIQRVIIKNNNLAVKVAKAMRDTYVVAHDEDNLESIKKSMIELRSEFMPVIDSKGKISKIIFWEDIFPDSQVKPIFKFSLPVVIMAGGQGTRLRPLTYVLPKPLIPINNKTLIEEIFERFHNHGCNDFFVSVNYKADLIAYYLNNQLLPYNINYFQETKPLGTAGSLALLKGKIEDTFFVTNCDILIDQDYAEILDYHRKNKNEITIVAAMKNYPIPYGTLETGNNGKLLNFTEKPELLFKINSGMYILEPHLLNDIPEGQFFHITDLIQKIYERNGNVGVFPITEKSWTDIGNWTEYFKIISQYSPEK